MLTAHRATRPDVDELFRLSKLDDPLLDIAELRASKANVSELDAARSLA